MVHTVIYCMRGWIAFVAFIEFGNAARCFIDEKKFLSANLFIHDDNEPGELRQKIKFKFFYFF